MQSAETVTDLLVAVVVSQVWQGNGVVASARKLIGATNPLAAEPGTIRGDFAIEVRAAAAAANSSRSSSSKQ
jgi:nucleoside-diphosphate kinase